MGGRLTKTDIPGEQSVSTGSEHDAKTHDMNRNPDDCKTERNEEETEVDEEEDEQPDHPLWDSVVDDMFANPK